MIGKLAILGLGLMGGSLAASLKRTGYARHIVAWGRSEKSLVDGLSLGVIDDWTLDLVEAVTDADVVVVCSPSQVAEKLIVKVIGLAADTTVITDVASVKGNIRAAITAACGSMPSNVVLGHPIAGAEKSGVHAAKADLFDRHCIILTPEPNSDQQSVDTLTAMWQACCATVATMSVDDHDQILAGTSHLPHMLAYSMIGLLAKLPTSHDVFKYAAGGLRDFTRIAASDPQMWTEIALSNKSAILGLLASYQAELASLEKMIDAGDVDGLMANFKEAKASRDYFSELLAAKAK